MEKLERGSSDVVTGSNSKITFVRWKDNKVVTVASTLYGQSPMKKAQRYIKKKHGRVDIEQSKSIYQYNQGMGGIDRLDQNISTYMIGHRSKVWWCQFVVFVLIYHSVMLIRFIAIKKHLLGGKTLSAKFQEKNSEYLLQSLQKIYKIC